MTGLFFVPYHGRPIQRRTAPSSTRLAALLRLDRATEGDVGDADQGGTPVRFPLGTPSLGIDLPPTYQLQSLKNVIKIYKRFRKRNDKIK